MKNPTRHARIFISALLFVMSILTLSAQDKTVTHTISRGETLESIAAKYGVTPQAIIDMNPDAKDFIYIGMELQIPVIQAQSTAPGAKGVSDNRNAASSVFMSANPNPPAESYTDEIRGPGWGPFYELEYGFPEKPRKVSSKDHTFAATFKFVAGGDYYFVEEGKSIFSGIGIGYSWYTNSYSTSSREIPNTDTSIHYITIPIHVGYKIPVSGNFGLTPLIGLDMNCPVSAKFKRTLNKEKETKNLKKSLAVNFNLGIGFSFSNVEIFGRYNMPVNKKQKAYSSEDGYFSIGVGGRL